MKTHNQAAFAVGPTLLNEVPSDVAWSVCLEAWDGLNDDVKTGMLKAFMFNNHPRVLDVLDLGATDPSLRVRNYAFEYLASFAFQDFAEDYAAYGPWREKYAGQSADEVMAANLRPFTARLAGATGSERQRLARFIEDELEDLKEYPLAREAAMDAGLAGTAVVWMGDPAPDRDVIQSASRILQCLHLSEDELSRSVLPLTQRGHPLEVRCQAVLTLRDPANRWAVDPLLKLLVQTLEREDELQGLIRWIAGTLGDIGDPRAVPTLIGVIDAVGSREIMYDVGYGALYWLTGVDYDESHDGAWWRAWWARNKGQYPQDVQALTIPDLRDRVAADQKEHDRPAAMADVADIPAQSLRAGGDENKRYFLIGGKGTAVSEEGYRLIIVLPGGDAGPDFHPFVRRIYKQVLSKNYLVAQLVAKRWSADQFDRVVWPTTSSPWEGMKFSTEEFVTAVVQDVKRAYKINERCVFVLAWSSGGPAAYAVSLHENTPITGSFVAMSVFKPKELPSLERASGHAYYILHSPEDFIPIRMAEAARDALRDLGATVKLGTYSGGHGWHGDVYGMIRAGIQWLEKQVR